MFNFIGARNGQGSQNTFHDPRATFAQFFGTSNPFASFFDMEDNILDKNVFEMDSDRDFFQAPFAGLGTRHGLGGAFR